MTKEIVLNARLLLSQNVDATNEARIKYLHKIRHYIINEMYINGADRNTLRAFAKMITEIDFELQRSWNFPMDKRFHRFFDLPHCTCPTIDNLERLGTDYQIINMECIIHGA